MQCLSEWDWKVPKKQKELEKYGKQNVRVFKNKLEMI